MKHQLWILFSTLFILNCNGCGKGDSGSHTGTIDTNTGLDTGTGSGDGTGTGSGDGTDTEIVSGEWIAISPGSFWMGSPDGDCPPDYPGGTDCAAELGRYSDEDLHYVTLTRQFEILSTEVTQGQYHSVTGWNPSSSGPNFPGTICGNDCPVERVSVYDALVYANELSRIAGLSPCYKISDIVCIDGTAVGQNPLGCMNDEQYTIVSAGVTLNDVNSVYECHGYRLPTESEWEYATRAGSTTAFYTSDGNDGSITDLQNDPNMNQIGWCSPIAEGDPHQAKLKEPNEWGLFDVSGNITEYTWDIYAAAYSSGDTSNPVVDPESAVFSDSKFTVCRGGDYVLTAGYSRSASRQKMPVGGAHGRIGFRLVRTMY